MATTAPIILPIKTPGLSDLQKLERRMKALENTVESLNKDLLKNAAVTKKSSKAAATATGNIQRMGIAFRTTLGPIVAITGAVTFLSKSLQVAGDREVNVATLANGLKNLGAAQADLERLTVAADKFGRATLFDQEDATQAFALLTSFQRIGVESYERVTKAASDLATVTGGDLKSAQLQLAKALEDPTKQVTALARSGTVFTEQQKEQIKVLQETGRIFEAQNLILSEIEKQYGGAAEAAGNAGLAGALDTLGEATRDFQEALINSTGTISLAEGAIKALADAIDIATAATKDLNQVLGLLDGIIKTVIPSVDGLGGVWDATTNRILNSLPIIKDAIRLYRLLTLTAQAYEDGKKGTRNFGLGYAMQEKELFEAAGGWSPYNKPKPNIIAPPVTTRAGKAKGGSGKSSAERELERQRQILERQFKAGEDIKRNMENRMLLLTAATDIEKERLQIAIDLDNQIRRIQQTAAPSQQNGLIVTATEEARLKDMLAMAQNFGTTVGQNLAKSLPEANKELTETDKLLRNAYDIMAGGMQDAINGLIRGTKDLNDVLSDMLGQLGNLFMQFAFNSLKTSIFPGMASGGYPTPGKPVLVGENGPELIVPTAPTRVYNNHDTNAMLGKYSPGGGGGTITFESRVINNVEYVTAEQAIAMSEDAARRGAEGGYTKTMGSLRNSRSTRQRVGI